MIFMGGIGIKLITFANFITQVARGFIDKFPSINLADLTHRFVKRCTAERCSTADVAMEALISAPSPLSINWLYYTVSVKQPWTVTALCGHYGQRNSLRSFDNAGDCIRSEKARIYASTLSVWLFTRISE